MGKQEKEDAPKDEGKPSDMFVATRQGFHGRMLRAGQHYSRGQLIAAAGFVPDYCAPVGTPEADEADEDAKGSKDGFASNEERVNYLMAKGVSANVKMGKAKLQKLIDEVGGGVNPLLQ
jgi:hypothetical protein